MTYIQIGLMLLGFFVGMHFWVKGRMANNDWRFLAISMVMIGVIVAGLIWFLNTHS